MSHKAAGSGAQRLSSRRLSSTPCVRGAAGPLLVMKENQPSRDGPEQKRLEGMPVTTTRVPAVHDAKSAGLRHWTAELETDNAALAWEKRPENVPLTTWTLLRAFYGRRVAREDRGN